jgi:dihydroorotase
MQLTIRKPDDWHIHLRDGEMLAAVLPHTARQFARAIVMPNLVPPVTTSAMAAAYRERILAALPAGLNFMPLMTCYLTDHTDPDDLQRGFRDGIFTAAKLYPAHATTNSAHGVSDISAIGRVLECMQSLGMPLLMHGEVTDPTVDIFDREAVFLERVLAPLIARYPALRIVLEHVTTEEAVAFVRGNARNLAATITAHHLVINRNAIFQGGIRPHLYCLPIAKREKHRLALRQAATTGEPCFFLGTDTAPHVARAKESGCGCAGVYTALNALEVYVQVFEEEEALARFEAFASLNGPHFYNLPVNEGMITLEKTDWLVPEAIPVGSGSDVVKPFRGGETLPWKLVESAHV